MPLIIQKKIGNVFDLIGDDGIKIDGNPNATAIGGLVNFKTRNGAILFKDIIVGDITVIDDNTHRSDTYSNATDLFIRLKALGFFDTGNGAIGGGDNTFVGLNDTSVTLPPASLEGQIQIWRNGILTNESIPNAFGVNSWNGNTGDVIVTSDHLPEGLTNLYYTETRVSNNPDVSLNTTHRDRVDNPHQVTKTQVGLGSVDNTSDLNKPISNSTQIALNDLDNKIGIVRNGNYPTLANVIADTSLSALISKFPNQPICVLNEDGRIYLYDYTLGEWRENKAFEIVYGDDLLDFPVSGDVNTMYVLRASLGVPAKYYNWDGFSYTLMFGAEFIIDDDLNPSSENAVKNYELYNHFKGVGEMFPLTYDCDFKASILFTSESQLNDFVPTHDIHTIHYSVNSKKYIIIKKSKIESPDFVLSRLAEEGNLINLAIRSSDNVIQNTGETYGGVISTSRVDLKPFLNGIDYYVFEIIYETFPFCYGCDIPSCILSLNGVSLEYQTNDSVFYNIKEYNTVADLPAFNDFKIDLYAFVTNDIDKDKRGLYLIRNGGNIMLYHYHDLNTPIIKTGINEIDLADIVNGITYVNGGDGFINDPLKYTTNFIPVRNGSRLSKLDIDTYRFFDIDKNEILFSSGLYNGSNNDNVISIDNEIIKFVKWTSDISNQNVRDIIVREYNKTSGNTPNGWADYYGYTRDNNNYVYEKNGRIWRKNKNNLLEYRDINYNFGYDSLGVIDNNVASTNFIKGNEKDIYIHDFSGNRDITFWDIDKVFISGINGQDFSFPVGAIYFKISIPRSINDFKNINIYQNSKQEVDYFDIIDSGSIQQDKPIKTKVCLIGDSFCSENSVFANSVSYATLMRDSMRLDTFINVSDVDKSISSFSTDIDSGRYPMPKSDLYIIALGTEDFDFANQTAIQVRDNLIVLERKIFRINPKSQIIFFTPLPRTDQDTANGSGAKLIDISNEIIRFCYTNGHLVYDLFSKSGLNPFNTELNSTYFDDGLGSPDGIHPNNIAHDILLFPEIMPFISNIILNYHTIDRNVMGWAWYIDDQYTDISPFTVLEDEDLLLPNNSAIKINNALPVGFNDFYDGAEINSEYNEDSFSVLIRFSAINSAQTGAISIKLFIPTLGFVHFDEKVLVKKTGHIDKLSFLTVPFTDGISITNGIQVYIESLVGDTDIYEISYKIDLINRGDTSK